MNLLKHPILSRKSCRAAGGTFGKARLFRCAAYGLYSLLAGLVLFGATPAAAQVSLKFGIYASEKPTLLVSQFRPLLNFIELAMSSDLGEPVHIELHVAPNYQDGIKALSDGQVDFARLGPASYVIAKKSVPGLELLALENDGGDKYYQGVIFTRADSGVTSLADLKGKRFAFGDSHSTSGRYLSQYALLHAGVRAKDLADFQYLGRHDRVAEAVWQGDFAAGAVKEDVFLRMQKEGRAIRPLAWMKNVTGPWAAREGLAPRLVASLRNALLKISGPAVFSAIGKQGFLPHAKGDLDLVTDAMGENPRFFN